MADSEEFHKKAEDYRLAREAYLAECAEYERRHGRTVTVAATPEPVREPRIINYREKPGADQRMKYGPYKGETFGQVASAEGERAQWIQKLKKTASSKRAQYQEEFLRWMNHRSISEDLAGEQSSNPTASSSGGRSKMKEWKQCDICDYKPTRGSNFYVVVSKC